MNSPAEQQAVHDRVASAQLGASRPRLQLRLLWWLLAAQALLLLPGAWAFYALFFGGGRVENAVFTVGALSAFAHGVVLLVQSCVLLIAATDAVEVRSRLLRLHDELAKNPAPQADQEDILQALRDAAQPLRPQLLGALAGWLCTGLVSLAVWIPILTTVGPVWIFTALF